MTTITIKPASVLTTAPVQLQPRAAIGLLQALFFIPTLTPSPIDDSRPDPRPGLRTRLHGDSSVRRGARRAGDQADCPGHLPQVLVGEPGGHPTLSQSRRHVDGDPEVACHLRRDRREGGRLEEKEPPSQSSISHTSTPSINRAPDSGVSCAI